MSSPIPSAARPSESAIVPGPAVTVKDPAPPGRVSSIDAYRGWVMFLMMAEVLEFCRVAASRPGNAFWTFLCRQQSHVEWAGCSLHDLIQPSFSFLVGVALPFSLARRHTEGQSSLRRTLHAFWRALLLILLGVFLRSIGQSQTYWTFEDTLTQIGLGYGFLYLLALKSTRTQWIAFAAILAGYWLAFVLYPLPGADFNWAAAGVAPGSAEYSTGLAAHWNKNTNLAWAFDTWFLNLFPREQPFQFNEGGYATLSFIPTLATMLMGLQAGKILRSERSLSARVAWLSIAGLICLSAGVILDVVGVCPVVKRIWTPSWTLFSGGWCLLLMAAFYWLMDVRGWTSWAFPLRVIGLNSIAAYVIAHLFPGFIGDNLAVHLGAGTFAVFGEATVPAVRGALVLLMMWLILFWMYRRKLFLKI